MKLVDVVQRLKLVNDYDQCRAAMNDAVIEIESLRHEVRRYKFLKNSYAMANFDIYEAEKGEKKVTGLIFEMPENISVSANLDNTIDDAIKLKDSQS
jgi:hypothetical protein